ncbi:MAG: S9 family peptidase [Bryobacterales bacterium]|nr:S9 family peptidase [Bryobacterales bacterium]
MSHIFAAVVLAGSSLAAQKAPFDVEAMLRLNRISDSQAAPDGRGVAFTVQTVDLANNVKHQQIFLTSLHGANPRAITAEGDNERPRWSPDSTTIAFLSTRSGASQIWLMDSTGANARQLTSLPTGAEGVTWSPDGKNLIFTSEVYPECNDDACNRAHLDADQASKLKARIYDTLLYRHWDHWNTARRRHLMVVPVAGGTPIDLTPGERDVPPFSLGGGENYTVSPDGAEVCYVSNGDAVLATSTNTDLFTVPIAGGDPKRITINPGADEGPIYSPDGKYLAYRSQQRAGYESDRWRLMLLERATGRVTAITEGTDRWVENYAWTPDSSQIFFVTEDRGRTTLQRISPLGGAARIVITGGGQLGDVQFTADGKTLIYTENRLTHPTEIFAVQSSGGQPAALTRLNDVLLAGYDLPPAEVAWVESADRTPVHYFLLKPPGFTADRKYPVLVLIHGGPQGAWGESWSYRWNAEVFAASGYVVVMPNPRGSIGYGQKFIDEINGDWGGKPYADIMAVVDQIAGLSYVDRDRMAAAGASYGGYMVDWILGHSNRFRCLVSHAGVFDLRSMFGATDELWFPLWEFQGTPWDNPDMYARWSPSYFVKDFQTPTLVSHGELDFRVPYTQGLQLFTSLQLKKVPSRLLIFPDEGHWINKPRNSALWYKTVIEWLNQWTKPTPPPALPVPGTPPEVKPPA